MQPFFIKDVLEATGGRLVCGSADTQITGVSTDSRQLSADTLFVPLKGESFDGHDFTAGANNYISQRQEEPVPGKCIIMVEDTLKAFGAMAARYKEKYSVPVISVVGSVGKTTTRDFTAAVLSQKYNTLKTDKNYNNAIGVPIMLFRLEAEHEAAVLELGMSAEGEIRYLADIVRPDTVIMTNIGMSHIENLGSQENIFKAKMEALERMTEKNTVIANGDDKFLKNVSDYGPYKVILYGVENKDADVRAEDIEDLGLEGSAFTAVFGKEKVRIRLRVPGIHNVYNALAAFAAGLHSGIAPRDAAAGLENAGLTAMRMEIISANGMKIINDCYNSAPDSVNAALRVLGGEKKSRRVAVLGDIFELGDFAPGAHTDIGKKARTEAEVLVCVGKNARYIAEGAGDMKHIYSFETTEEAAKSLPDILLPGDTVLLKASRGMHFEKLFEKITEG